MNLTVCKFGGSSLADGNNISRVAEIVKSDPVRRYVVVSAPGKRYSDDIKVTDLLYACYKESVENGNCAETFAKIGSACIITDTVPDERYKKLTVIKTVEGENSL